MNPGLCGSEGPSDTRLCESIACREEGAPADVVLDFSATLAGTGPPPEPETVASSTRQAFSRKLGVEEDAILVQIEMQRRLQPGSAWQMNVLIEVRCEASTAAEVFQELEEVRRDPEQIGDMLPPGTSMEISPVTVRASEKVEEVPDQVPGHPPDAKASVEAEEAEETEDSSSQTLLAVLLSLSLAMLAIFVACCRRRSAMLWKYKVMAEETAAHPQKTFVTTIDDESSTQPPSDGASQTSKEGSRPSSSASIKNSADSSPSHGNMSLKELRQVAKLSLTELQEEKAKLRCSAQEPRTMGKSRTQGSPKLSRQAAGSPSWVDPESGIPKPKPKTRQDKTLVKEVAMLQGTNGPAKASTPPQPPGVGVNKLPLESLHLQVFRSPRGLPPSPPSRTASSSLACPSESDTPPKPSAVVRNEVSQEAFVKQAASMPADRVSQRAPQMLAAPRIPDVPQFSSHGTPEKLQPSCQKHSQVVRPNSDSVMIEAHVPKAATLPTSNQRRVAKPKPTRPVRRIIEE